MVEVVEEGDCPTTNEDSAMDSDIEVFWAKSARPSLGVRGERKRVGRAPGIFFLTPVPRVTF